LRQVAFVVEIRHEVVTLLLALGALRRACDGLREPLSVSGVHVDALKSQVFASAVVDKGQSGVVDAAFWHRVQAAAAGGVGAARDGLQRFLQAVEARMQFLILGDHVHPVLMRRCPGVSFRSGLTAIPARGTSYSSQERLLPLSEL